MPCLVLKEAMDFRAGRAEGFCPVIRASSREMISWSLFSLTRPIPVLTTTLEILGTAKGELKEYFFISAGRTFFSYFSFKSMLKFSSALFTNSPLPSFNLKSNPDGFGAMGAFGQKFGGGERRGHGNDASFLAGAAGPAVAFSQVGSLHQRPLRARIYLKDFFLPSLVFPGDYENRIAFFDAPCHGQTTSAAKEIIFKKPLSRSSRGTGPTILPPLGSVPSKITTAFSSKRT